MYRRPRLEDFINRRFNELSGQITQLKEMLVSAQDDINAIATDLGTVATTLSDAITRLETEVAAGQTPDLTALKNVQATLDALAAANPEPTPPVV